MARTLVIRLSALGDVAIALPVLYSVANRYPGDMFIFLTKRPFDTLLEGKPENITLFPVNMEGKNKNIFGLIRLIKEVNKLKINQVADLHDVLRTAFMDWIFRMMGKKVAVINKERKKRKALTRRKNKRFLPLKTSLQRYQAVFEALGYDASVQFTSLFPEKTKKSETWIGIAPFARHFGKIYPLEKMEEVVRRLSEKPLIRLFIFGGKQDRAQLEHWTKKYPQVQLVPKGLTLHEELALMNDLDVMVSMDSANMHLASLVATPVVSVWGATHPYAGFYGFRQPESNTVQIDLACRPCSIYGGKPCYIGSYACLQQITPQQIIEKINELLT